MPGIHYMWLLRAGVAYSNRIDYSYMKLNFIIIYIFVDSSNNQINSV